MGYKPAPLWSDLNKVERRNLNKGFDTEGSCIDQVRQFIGDSDFLVLGFQYRGVPYAGHIASSLGMEEADNEDGFKSGAIHTVYFYAEVDDHKGNVKGWTVDGINKQLIKLYRKIVFVDESFSGYDGFGLPPHFVAARKMLRYSYQVDDDTGNPVCNLTNCTFVKCLPFELMTAEQVYRWTFERMGEDRKPRFKMDLKDLGSGSTNNLINQRGKELKTFVGEVGIQKGDYLVCAPMEHSIDAFGVCLDLNGDNRGAFCEVGDDFPAAMAKKSPEDKKIIIVGPQEEGTKSHQAYRQLVEQRHVSTDNIRLVSV